MIGRRVGLGVLGVLRASLGGLSLALALALPAAGGAQSTDDDPPVQVPEPLMRGFVQAPGAPRGSAEVNALLSVPLRDVDGGAGTTGKAADGEVLFAPQVEWVVARGLGVELEPSFQGGGLESVATSVQWTLGVFSAGRAIHGLQASVEWFDDPDLWEVSALWLAGLRLDPTWSAVVMAGARASRTDPGTRRAELLLRASGFADLWEGATLGLETDASTDLDRRHRLLILPQIHLSAGARWSVLAGLGARLGADVPEPQLSVRGIYRLR